MSGASRTPALWRNVHICSGCFPNEYYHHTLKRHLKRACYCGAPQDTELAPPLNPRVSWTTRVKKYSGTIDLLQARCQKWTRDSVHTSSKIITEKCALCWLGGSRYKHCSRQPRLIIPGEKWEWKSRVSFTYKVKPLLASPSRSKSNHFYYGWYGIVSSDCHSRYRTDSIVICCGLLMSRV